MADLNPTGSAAGYDLPLIDNLYPDVLDTLRENIKRTRAMVGSFVETTGDTMTGTLSFDGADAGLPSGAALVKLINPAASGSYWLALSEQTATQRGGVAALPDRTLLSQTNPDGTQSYQLAVANNGQLVWRGNDLGRWADFTPGAFAGRLARDSSDVPDGQAGVPLFNVSMPGDSNGIAFRRNQPVGNQWGAFNFVGLGWYLAGLPLRIGGTARSVEFNAAGQMKFLADVAPGGWVFDIAPDGNLAITNSDGKAIWTGAGISAGTVRGSNGDVYSGHGGFAGEVHFSLNNNNAAAYFYMSPNGESIGLYDITRAIVRWSTDASGNFQAAANITAYSDRRLKRNIQPITSALSRVLACRGVTYDRIDTGQAGVGVIADEVRAVFPELVMEGSDENKTLSVAYGNLVAPLIEAVRELAAQVDALKAEVAALRAGG